MGNRTIIIAEAGVNHNGSLEVAKQLIDVAAEAEVDYVKFQTFNAAKLVSKNARKASYQVENTKSSGEADDTQFAMLKKLELGEADHYELLDYCRKKNVRFLSTGFDMDALAFLKQLGVTLAKIPSGEITNLPYLRKIAELFEQVIISTGMATLQDIRAAVAVLEKGGVRRANITVLHCNTEYPTPMKDVNLRAMNLIGKELEIKIGYSDHTMGIEVPIAAVAMGATVIEKHFTLDRNAEGPDHKASLEPLELKAMVTAIRNIEDAVAGSGYKEPSASELKNIAVARKSIVAIAPIAKGEVFSPQNIGVKRPGNGISPMLWDDVIGKTASRDFGEDELIEL